MQKNTLLHRTSSGTIFLLIRQVIVQLLNFIGSIYIARNLSVGDYGFFGILTFVFSFVLNFGDIGFSASLIKQNEKPLAKDFNNIFTIQFILNLFLALILSVSSSFLCKIYKISDSYSIFFIIVSCAIVILALKTIPTVKLEREIQFGYLSIIEIIQAIVYNGTAIILSYMNYGPYSFTLALLFRTLVGTICVFVVSPVKVKFEFDIPTIKRHLHFGLPYQIGTLVNVIKDSMSPVVVGLLLTVGKTGIVNMASLIASFPSMLLFILNRLFFPAFSRAKDYPEQLNLIFKLGIILANSIAALIAIFILIMCKPFIIFVFGSKWLIAQDLVYYFWTVNLFLPSMLVSSSLMFAKGYPKLMMKFNIVTLILSFATGIPLILKLDIIGVGISNVVINTLMLFVIIKAQEILNYRIISDIIRSWIPGIIAGGILLIVLRYNVTMTLGYFIILLVLYSLLFLAISFLINIKIIKEYKSFLWDYGISSINNAKK